MKIEQNAKNPWNYKEKTDKLSVVTIRQSNKTNKNMLNQPLQPIIENSFIQLCVYACHC